MAIDLRVSRAVTKIHALERAVHDSGPWSIRLGSSTVPAQRIVGENEVSFIAEFPISVQEYGSGPHKEYDAFLYCGNNLVTVMSIYPPDSAFRLNWELALPLGVAA